MVSRIITKGCPKCGGALKEDTREREWSCMNCGMLYLPANFSRVSESKLHEPQLPGEKAKSSKKSTLDTLNQDPVLDPEDLGDDSEWERLNPQLKLVSKKEWLGNYNICKQCGKKGSYTYIPDDAIVNEEYDESLSKQYCKFCSPRRSWKPGFKELR